MTALGLDISHTLYKIVSKIEAAFVAFTESKIVKAWEEAARLKAQVFVAQSTYKELNRLSDKELRDIGISRGEIYDVAYGHKK